MQAVFIEPPPVPHIRQPPYLDVSNGRATDMESGQTMSEGLALRMKLTLDSTAHPAP